MDSTQPATAQEFADKWGVTDQALAADLARQANAMSGRLGADAQAEQRHSLDGWAPPPPAAPPPQPTALELSDMAQAHSESPVQAAMAAEFAPAASSSEFSFPAPASGHNDESMAQAAQAKAAFHAAGMNPKSVNLAVQMLHEDMPSQLGKTFDQIIDTQHTGLERMWRDEVESNLAVWKDIVTGWQKSSDPLIRQYAQLAPRLNPIVVNRFVEESKFRSTRSK
jgi:hypothetical protein